MFTTLQPDGRSFLRPVLFLLVLVSAALAFPARGDPPVPAAALPNYAVTTPAPVTGVPLAIVYRYGGQWNEWFVRGDADVSPSPSLARGARLSAWDGDNPNDLSRVAVATAVYLIPLPPGSQSLIIDVGYQPQDTARNKTVAGFLFVRDRAVERQYAAADKSKTGPFDEPGFYGDTYLLPAGQVRATFEIPAADRLGDGILELHLSAGAGQVLDVQYVQVTAQTTPAPAPIAAVEPAAPVTDSSLPYGTAPAPEQYVNPYDYSYTYYYAGPWYWPYDGYIVSYPLYCAGFDWFACGGWYPYRCCFWNHHDWCSRPAGVAWERRAGARDDHGNARFSLRGGGATAATVNAYRSNWLSRNFHVAAGTSTDVTGMTRPVKTPFQSHSAGVTATGSGMHFAGTFQPPRSRLTPAASTVASSPTHWTITPRSAEAMPHVASAASPRSWTVTAAPQPRVAQHSFQPAPMASAASRWSFSNASSGRSVGFSGWGHSSSGFTSGGRTGGFGGRR